MLTLIAVDGHPLRYSEGGELVSAIGAESGRWLDNVCTPDNTIEIRAARSFVESVSERRPQRQSDRA